MAQNVLAVILGGGRGTRLYPLTKVRSKPAVPIGGKYRLVDIPISNCLNSGIYNIYVLTQFNSASLNRHIHRTYQFSPFTKGFVEILAAEQTMDSADWFQGTADAVRQCMRYFNDHDHRDILILSGDHLYRMDYERFLATHRRTGADVTVSVQPVGPQEASGFGILETEGEGRITRFVEKPADPETLASLRLPGAPEERSYLASMGIYLFRKEVLMSLLRDGGEEDFGRQIIPKAISRCNVSAHRFEGYWEDIGTIGAFHRANIACTQSDPPFSFYVSGKPVFTHPRFLPSSQVEQCEIRSSLISEGVRICGAKVSDSVIGVRSVVACGVTVRRSVIMGADYYEADGGEGGRRRRRSGPAMGIGPGCTIENAIIDKNARIGEGAQIVNARGVEKETGENYIISDGIVVIPKDAVIPPGTVI